MNYRNRNKLISIFRLWPIILLQAKIRKKRSPQDPRSSKWLEVVEKQIELNKINLEAKKAYKGKIDILEIKALETLAEKVLKNALNPIYIESLLKRFKLQNLEKPFISILYTQIKLMYDSIENLNNSFYIEYIYYRSTGCNKAKEMIALRNYIDYSDASERVKNFLISKIQTKDFLFVSDNGFEKLSQPTNGPKKIVLISPDYDSALESILYFPKNSKVHIYLLNSEDNQINELKLNQQKIQIKISDFISSIHPLSSKIDLKSLEYTKEISKILYNNIETIINSISNDNEPLKFIKDGMQLHIDDLALADVKTILAIEELLNKFKNIYVIHDKSHKINLIIQYLHGKLIGEDVINNKLSNIKFYLSSNQYKAINYKLYKILFNNKIVQKTVDALTAKEEFIRFYNKNISRIYFPSTSKYFFYKNKIESYVMVALNAVDKNYREASKVLISKIIKDNNVLLHSLNSQHIETRNFYKKYKKESKKIVQLISNSPRDLKERTHNESMQWTSYVKKEVYDNLIQSKAMTINGINFNEILNKSLPNIIETFLPAAINYKKELITNFERNKPEYFITIPGRIANVWIASEISNSFGIKVIEVQAVFQSAHPRYKPSKANVFAMINDEQINTYKNNFKIKLDQKIVKIGPILLTKTIEKIKKLNIAKLKNNFNISEKEKTILFATQYLNIEHCSEILEVLLQEVKDIENIRVIVKTHPKEVSSNISRYKEIALNNNMEDRTLVLDKADLHETLVVSDLVITLFSNVGMEAGLIGKDVWSVNLFDEIYPADITKEGLAKKIEGTEDFKLAVHDFLNENNISRELNDSRMKFINDNPEIFDESTFDRIVDDMKYGTV